MDKVLHGVALAWVGLTVGLRGLWWLGWAVVALLMGLLGMTGPLVAALVVVLPQRWRPLGRMGALVAALVCAVQFVTAWDAHQADLSARAQAGTWTDRDRAAVWLGNLVMAAGGVAAGYPEVARETAWLAVSDGTEQKWRGDFLLGSARIGTAIDDDRRWLEGRTIPREGLALPGHKILWPHHRDPRERRASLAMNPCLLRGKAFRAEAGVVIAYDCSVWVHYSEGVVPLVPGLLNVDEALFSALERDGWLTAYRATWGFEALARPPVASISAGPPGARSGS